MQGNWLLPIYPALAILAALAAAHGGRAGALLLRIGSALGIGAALALSIYMASPAAGTLPLRGPADGAIGWEALSDRIDVLARHHRAGWIATTNYGVTAELSYHLQDQWRVIDVAEPVRYAFDGAVAPIGDTAGLLVLRGRDPGPEALAACFGSVTRLARLARGSGGPVLEDYHLFRVEDAIPSRIRLGCR